MKVFATWVLLTCLLLAACGTKGPLYIPEQRYPQKSDVPNDAPKSKADKSAQ